MCVCVCVCVSVCVFVCVCVCACVCAYKPLVQQFPFLVPGKCLPVKDEGQGCTAAGQCTDNSECDLANSVCKCDAGFYAKAGRCWPLEVRNAAAAA